MAQKFTITAELNLQTKNLSQVVNNLKQQFQGANLNIKIKDLAQAEASVRNISKGAKEAQGSFNSLGSSIASAAKRFSAITLATGTFVGLGRAIKNSISDAIEFDREMVKIAQATGKTVAQLQSLKNEIASVSMNFGASSKELLLAARNLTQAGFAADKVAGSLKLLAQTELAATFDSIADTTEGVIAVLNQFGREAQRTGTEVDFLERSLSSINQVSKEFAVESSDLITAIRTTGSAFESAGGSLDELIALFTSVRATTRESAESIATGFRTIFTRTQRLDTINNLKKLGIELQDAEGKFVGPMEAAKRLSIALNTIDPKDFRFNLIVEQLGGFRQVSKVIPLIQQFGVAQRALNVAQGSSGSLAKDAATAQQALSVQIQKTREQFSKFIRDLTESKSFKDTTRFLLDMASAFIKVADTLKPLIPMIAGFAAVKLGQSLLPGVQSLVGAKKKSLGGPIHAFASGGLVPGTGNGDTVPAMLTPGEFVIKKSSVKKLGVNSLANANKYASGGMVQYYGTNTGAGAVKENDPTKRDLSTVRQNIKAVDYSKDTNVKKQSLTAPTGKKPLEIGGAFLRPAGFNVDKTEFLPTGDLEIAKLNTTSLGNKLKDAYSNTKETGRGIYYNLNLRSLSDPKSSQIEASILKNVVNAVDESADILTDGLGQKSADINLGEILKKANIDQVSGNIFEAMLLNVGAPFDNTEKSSTSFDFRDGLKEIAGNFDDAENLKTNPTDARNSVTTSSIGGFETKVNSFLQEEIKKVKTNELAANADVELAKFGSQATTFDSIRGSRAVQALTGLTGKAKVEEVKEALAAKGYDLIQSGAKGKYTISKKFADGGLASGTDTVPAMLTPGEFVINKKSAQKIGASSLNRMNKVGKFADGGPVQYLNPGGNVGKFGKVSGATALGGPKAQPFDFSSKASSAGNIPTNNSKVQASVDNVASSVDSLSSELDKMIESSQRTGAGFLLLGSVAASLTSQMSGMDKAWADGITAFTGTFSTMYGIGQSLKTTGLSVASSVLTNKKHTKAIEDDSRSLATHSSKLDSDTPEAKTGNAPQSFGKLGAAVKIAEGGITGFALATAAQAAIVAYQSAKAQKEADKLSKAMESFTKNLNNEASVRTGMTKTLLMSERAQARSNAASSKEAMAGGAAGTLVGGAIGFAVAGPMGAQIGAGILSTIGTLLGAEMANTFDSAKITQASNQLSDAFITATRGVSELNKFMGDIDKKSTQQVTSEFNRLAADASKANSALGKFDPNILDTGSETMKASFIKAGETVDAFQQGMDKLNGAITAKYLKDMEAAAKVGVIFDESKIDKFMAQTSGQKAGMVEAKYKPQIDRAKGTEKEALVKLQAQEIGYAAAEYKKSLLESSIQVLKQERAIVQEKQAREKIIGTLIEENALKATLERFNASTEKAAKSSDSIDAAFSDSVQGLKSAVPDSSVFDMEFPDTSSLNEAMDRIKAIGPIGEKLSSSLSDLNKISIGLGPALEALGAKGFGELNIDQDISKVVSEGFNIDPSGAVGSQLIKIIKDSYTQANQENSSGTAGTIDREAIKKQFEQLASDLKSKGKDILTAFEAVESKQRAVVDKLIQSEQRKLELANQSIDSYGRLVDAVAKAQGRSVSLIEKNSMRFAKQVALLGKNANKSIPQLGSDLAKARKSLSSGAIKDPLEQGKVSNQAKNLEQSLKNLANQSDRTADTLNEIEKFKAQREQIQQNLTNYAFGTDEERTSMDTAAAATNQVLQTGDINSVEGPLRKEVLGMLDTMGDFGKQAKKQLTANYFASQGNMELAGAAMAETSTPEMQLMDELGNIYQQEIAAQKALMDVEMQYGDWQIQEYQKLTDQIAGFNQQLANIASEFTAAGKKGTDAAGGPAPKLTTETIDQQIKSMQEKVTAITGSIDSFKKNIDTLNTILNTINQNKINAKEGRPPEAPPVEGAVGKARGGLIYLAKGGTAFAPKGTDTVPAMLTPGEFVMKKSAVDNIGVDNLNAMNNGYAKGGRVGYYASGGIVKDAPSDKYLGRGLVNKDYQEKINTAETDDERFNLAISYANQVRDYEKKKWEIAESKKPYMSRSRFKPDLLTRLKNEELGLEKNQQGNYKNTVSLYDLLENPEGSKGLFKLSDVQAESKMQGVSERETKDMDAAALAAWSQYGIPYMSDFATGFARGATKLPFIDLIQLALNDLPKIMGYEGVFNVKESPLGDLSYSGADVIANALGLNLSDAGQTFKIPRIGEVNFSTAGEIAGGILNPAELLLGGLGGKAVGYVFKNIAKSLKGGKAEAVMGAISGAVSKVPPLKEITPSIFKDNAALRMVSPFANSITSSFKNLASKVTTNYDLGQIFPSNKITETIAWISKKYGFRSSDDVATSAVEKAAVEQTKEGVKEGVENVASGGVNAQARKVAEEQAKGAEDVAKQIAEESKARAAMAEEADFAARNQALAGAQEKGALTKARDASEMNGTTQFQEGLKDAPENIGLAPVEEGLKKTQQEAREKAILERVNKPDGEETMYSITPEGNYKPNFDAANSLDDGAKIVPPVTGTLPLTRLATNAVTQLANQPSTSVPVEEPTIPPLLPTDTATSPVNNEAPVVEPTAPTLPGEPVKPAAETKKKRRRRRRGMNPNSMMAFNAMQNFGANWTQNAIAQARAAQQQRESSFYNFMNQGPQQIAGFATGGPVYLSGGGQPKGTDTVPAMLTPGEFVMNKSAVSKHGVGMMQHLNSGGEVKYFSGGSFVGPQQPEDDYNLSRSEMTSESIRTGLSPSELSDQRDKFTAKRDAERAKAKSIMDKIQKEKADKASAAKAQSAAGAAVGGILDPSSGFGSWDKSNKFLPPGMGPSPTPAPAANAAAAATSATAATDTAQQAKRKPSTQRGGGPMRDRAIQANAAMKANRMGFQQSMMNRNRPMTRSQMMAGGGGGENPMAQQQQQQMGGQAASGTATTQTSGGGAGGAGGGAGGTPDMSSFAASVESLNKISETFTKFTETLSGLAQQFSGLTVTHTMTINGAINVQGVNSADISRVISDNLTAAIKAEVLSQLSKQKTPEQKEAQQ